MIGILYTKIDRFIRGGNLHLRYDTNKWQKDWKIKPFEGSMIVFPNMPHRIKDLSYWDRNEYGIRRSLAFFLLYDTEMSDYNENFAKIWESTKACKSIMNGMHDYHPWLHQDSVDQSNTSYWNYINVCGKLPILTATDVMPVDKQHFEKIFDDILYNNVQQVMKIILPDIVVLIIKSFMVNDVLLKDEMGLWQNARDMRENRGYGIRQSRLNYRPLMN